MPRYDFKCKECGYIQKDLVFKMIDKPDTVPCVKCQGNCDSIIQATHFSISDLEAIPTTVGCVNKEGWGKESSKNSTYWRNAEKVKQNEIRKRQKVLKEKLASGDPVETAKAKRRAERAAINAANYD